MTCNFCNAPDATRLPECMEQACPDCYHEHLLECPDCALMVDAYEWADQCYDEARLAR